MINLLSNRNLTLLIFLFIISFSLEAQPPNDDCELATEILAGQTLVNETNVGSSVDINYNSNNASCNSFIHRRSVWYKYDHYTNGAIRIRIENFTTNILSMVITEGPCGNYLDGDCGDYSDTDQYFCNIPAGVYHIQIATKIEDTGVFDITMDSEPEISVNVNVINASCFGGNDGSAEVIASEGVPPYSYTMGSETNTDGLFENLATGNYNVLVEDAVSCTLSLDLNVAQPSEVTCSFSQVTDPNCGVENGSFQVCGQGGNGPYTYSIISGQSNDTGDESGLYTGLASGSYIVKTIDENGCEDACNISLSDTPSPTCSITNFSNPDCSINNGSFEIIGQDGNGPYTFEIISGNGNDSGNATGLYLNLGPGDYEVELTDFDGCTTTCTVSLLSPPIPTCSFNIDIQPSCGNADGAFTVSATGGDSGYSFDIVSGNGNNTGNGTGEYINLEADVYLVEVTDASNCKDTCTIDLESLSGPMITISNTSDVSCFGGNEGTATANASSGTSPYTYMWSNGSNDRVQLNLSPGDYTVTVTDGGGCTDKETINIGEPDEIICDIDVEDIGCFGTDSGKISIQCNGGTSPFTYTINNITNSTGTFNNLLAGTYDILIEDANACTAEETVVLNQSPPISCELEVSDERCLGDGQGSVQVMASGGSGNIYTYTLNSNISNTSGLFQNLSQGSYEVLIEDEGGCESICYFTIAPGSAKPIANFTALFNGNPTGNLPYNQAFALKNTSLPGDHSLDQSKTKWNVIDISNSSFSFSNNPFPIVGLDCPQNLMGNATNNFIYRSRIFC